MDSTDRRDEILRRLCETRGIVHRLVIQVEATSQDLRLMKKERDTQIAVMLGLVEELDGKRQTCRDCGEIRQIGAPKWASDDLCPECARRKP